MRGCHSQSAVFFTREDYELEARSSPSTCSTSAARTGSSNDASPTKPACKRSSCASDIESRSTPGVTSGGRTLCNHLRRISAARGSETARSRKPLSISASVGGSLLRRDARLPFGLRNAGLRPSGGCRPSQRIRVSRRRSTSIRVYKRLAAAADSDLAATARTAPPRSAGVSRAFSDRLEPMTSNYRFGGQTRAWQQATRMRASEQARPRRDEPNAKAPHTSPPAPRLPSPRGPVLRGKNEAWKPSEQHLGVLCGLDRHDEGRSRSPRRKALDPGANPCAWRGGPRSASRLPVLSLM